MAPVRCPVWPPPRQDPRTLPQTLPRLSSQWQDPAHLQRKPIAPHALPPEGASAIGTATPWAQL